jgi:hypothetical protein
MDLLTALNSAGENDTIATNGPGISSKEKRKHAPYPVQGYGM